jgi:hypothetical protein
MLFFSAKAAAALGINLGTVGVLTMTFLIIMLSMTGDLNHET